MNDIPDVLVQHIIQRCSLPSLLLLLLANNRRLAEFVTHELCCRLHADPHIMFDLVELKLGVVTSLRAIYEMVSKGNNVLPIGATTCLDNDDLTPLARAATLGKMDLMDCLLRYTYCSPNDPMVLCGLVSQGRLAEVDLLLSYAADANLSYDDKTPLQLAVQNDSMEMVALLLENGAKPLSGIIEVSKCGSVDMLHLLLEYVHDHDRKQSILFEYDVEHEFCTIHYACVFANHDMIAALLGMSRELVNFPSGMRTVQTSPLQWAVRGQALDAAKLLLSQGADINARDANQRSALHLCAQRGNLELLQVLLQEDGLDVNAVDVDGASALFYAIQCEDLDGVMMICQHKDFNINGVNQSGLTPLSYAVCCRASVHIINYLLTIPGIDVNLSLPLRRAILSFKTPEEVHLIDKMIDLGALPNLVPERHVVVAVRHGQCAALSAFLPHYHFKSGQALFFASLYGNVTMAELLLKRGADRFINYTHEKMNNKTALHVACRKMQEREQEHKKQDYIRIVKLLLRYGADTDAPDGYGRTPSLKGITM